MLICRKAIAWLLLVGIIGLLADVAGAVAVPIAIGNADFEGPDLGPDQSTSLPADLSPWVGSFCCGGAATYFGIKWQDEYLSSFPDPAGPQMGLAAYYGQSEMRQTLGVVYTANTTYTLEFDIVQSTRPIHGVVENWRVDFMYGGTGGVVDSGTIVDTADDITYGIPGPDSWTHVVHQYTTGSSGGEIGQVIEIRFGGSRVPLFDNFTLTADALNTFTLTVSASPGQVDTVTPSVGGHVYGEGTIVDISASEYVNCPELYVFDHWVGDGIVAPNEPVTTVVVDASKEITAVFVAAVPQCGDACHVRPEADFDGDCRVDINDFMVMAGYWLDFN